MAITSQKKDIIRALIRAEIDDSLLNKNGETAEACDERNNPYEFHRYELYDLYEFVENNEIEKIKLLVVRGFRPGEYDMYIDDADSLLMSAIRVEI